MKGKNRRATLRELDLRLLLAKRTRRHLKQNRKKNKWSTIDHLFFYPSWSYTIGLRPPKLMREIWKQIDFITNKFNPNNHNNENSKN